MKRPRRNERRGRMRLGVSLVVDRTDHIALCVQDLALIIDAANDRPCAVNNEAVSANREAR